MRKTRKRKTPSWEKLYRTTYVPLTDEQVAEHLRLAAEQGIPLTEEQARTEGEGDEVWTNGTYQCTVFFLDKARPFGWLHLSIKRRNKGVIRDWRDLQRIKNDVAGPEREAFEIFPAESRLVDTANQYHLWVLPEGERLPIGFEERLVSDNVGLSGARQRPFDR